MLGTVLRVAALACFAVAALNLAPSRVNLTAMGLALWVLAELLGGVALPEGK